MKKSLSILLLIIASFSKANSYDPKIFYGEAKRDEKGNIIYIEENSSQIHNKENFVLVKIKNIKIRPKKKEIGRIRIAVWDKKDVYAKEGEKPFRASSYAASEIKNGEIIFKISGLILGQSYSFFAHFDQDNKGKVARIFGIPKDPYVFSNGLKREGLGAPAFEKTLVKFLKIGQVVELNL